MSGLEDIDMDAVDENIKRVDALVKRMSSGEELTDAFMAEMSAAIGELERHVGPSKKEQS